MGARGFAAGLVLIVCLLCAVAPAAAEEIHVDCSATSAGDGSVGAPLNSIAAPFDLRASDNLLFRRGTACEGTLRITNSGQGADPKSVGAYGSGSAPRIIGTGRDAVLLTDVADLTFRDLDISNPGSGGMLGEGSQVRNGIRVVAQTVDVRNLTLTSLEIHDVDGDLTKNPEGSAAIQISATGPPPARFVNLLIKDNRIRNVSRSAISISGTNDPNRPGADQPWPLASSGVVVENNRIDLIAGDGIVPRGTDGAVVRGNVVSRGNLAGRPLLHPEGPMCNAGIWTFRANNTLIQGNEVFGMKHNGCDGTGFDVDYRQDGTVVEGNYSHHNEGGFILLCTDTGAHRAEVRFNLSVDDGTTINHGPCGLGEGIFGDLSGIRMFNNTVVADQPSVTMQLSPMPEMYEPGSFRFANNLVFSRQPAGPFACGNHCSHNAFFGLPASGQQTITADPLLTGPLVADEGMAGARGFRPAIGSPLYRAGVPIPDGPEADFFGTRVPLDPSIGFDQRVLEKSVPKPNLACRKARTVRTKAKRRVTKLKRRVKKLRRQRARPARLKPAVRKLRRARVVLKQKSRAATKACRAST